MNKVIVFDFDGTLTKRGQNIWKLLWTKCGYTTDKNSLYAKLYVAHTIEKSISRQEWFDLTCKAFRQKKLSYKDFYEESKKIELIDGAHEIFKSLYEKGYKLCIVSGCMKETIEIVLGESKKYFEEIKSNEICFDENGIISHFIPTPYDFQGKAIFVKEFAAKSNIKPSSIVFIGNGDNDEFAYLSGCKTICINPDNNTDKNNKNKWHETIDEINNLNELMPKFNR